MEDREENQEMEILESAESEAVSVVLEAVPESASASPPVSEAESESGLDEEPGTESTAETALESEPESESETEIEIETELQEPASGKSGRKKQKKYLIKNRIVREIVSWTLTILLAVFIAVFINAYLFRSSQVSGNSMNQTLHNQQMVYISRLPYLLGSPQRGDIVVFDSEQVPRNFMVEIRESFQYNAITYRLGKVQHPQKYWIKRIIGLPGDTVEIREDGVYVNGTLLDEPYVNPAETPNYATWVGRSWTVGKGELFVMGDNRNHSTDSREIGLVSQNAVLGKVVKQ